MVVSQDVSGGARESHELVDWSATPASLLRVTWRWLRVSLESLRVGWALRRRFARQPGESYWPLIRDDWARTFRGYVCVENLCLADWFERALAGAEPGGDCLYLMENQAWERTLASSWRAHGRGRLAAVAHSTIRYWDLRYHADPRRYRQGAVERPGPGAVITNGPVATAQYLRSVTLREPVAECEALRYGHLPSAPAPAAMRAAGEPLRLLVLGDHMPGPTDALLRLVQEALAGAPLEMAVHVKPHPTCPVNATNYPELALQVESRSIAELAASAHLVLASNTTSGAVDAFACGARVLVHDDLRGLNVSPLRGVDGVRFVHNAQDLRECLAAPLAASPRADGRAGRFFTIDPALPRWRGFLGLTAG
jgi:surface carbohydrate biosynthesis protein (TIGR04326 family)